MIFDDVISGSEWQPEPAARYNAVNALLRESAALPPSPQCGKGGWSVGKVLFYNTSASTISAWSAVALAPGTGAADPLHCLVGTPATDESTLWGVAQSSVPAGHCGEAVVSGITEAELASSGDSALNYVSPQSGGLTRSASGRAELLSASGTRALILLGGGSGGGNSYNGCFKIVRTSSGIAIVNGFQPQTTFCGYTDLPGCETVPRTEISGTPANVTLYVHYNSATQTYRTSFTESANAVMSQVIGRISGNDITQIWQSDYIYFSRFYFL